MRDVSYCVYWHTTLLGLCTADKAGTLLTWSMWDLVTQNGLNSTQDSRIIRNWRTWFCLLRNRLCLLTLNGLNEVVCLQRYLVRVSEVTVLFGFFSISRCMQGGYIELGHDLLLSNPYLLTLNDHFRISFDAILTLIVGTPSANIVRVIVCWYLFDWSCLK